MRRGTVVYRFGAFELHSASAQLLCAGRRVPLSAQQFAILHLLVSKAPEIIRRSELAKHAWGGFASDHSIEKAISRLRKALAACHAGSYIETVASDGYRFVGPVAVLDAHDTIAVTDLDGEPLVALIHGRKELATLRRDAIDALRPSLEALVEKQPDYAPALVALAHAYALTFEATRFDTVCDLDALRRAVALARAATVLDPGHGDAWSTFGFASWLDGDMVTAAVAARKATVLEPASWRHRLRLSFVSWGEERIEAAQATLMLCPDLVLAHWLMVTVLIARNAREAALIALEAGCRAQDRQPTGAAAYPGNGMHLLRGLEFAAQGRLGDAMCEFECELSAPDRGQLYSRECAANTLYAQGALHLRQREPEAADRSFWKALDIAPNHFPSLAALGLPVPELPADDPRATYAALARPVALTRAGRHPEAVQAMGDAIAAAPALSAGWILPVEPMLNVTARPEMWDALLTLVQQRAT